MCVLGPGLRFPSLRGWLDGGVGVSIRAEVRGACWGAWVRGWRRAWDADCVMSDVICIFLLCAGLEKQSLRGGASQRVPRTHDGMTREPYGKKLGSVPTLSRAVKHTAAFHRPPCGVVRKLAGWLAGYLSPSPL